MNFAGCVVADAGGVVVADGGGDGSGSVAAVARDDAVECYGRE